MFCSPKTIILIANNNSLQFFILTCWQQLQEPITESIRNNNNRLICNIFTVAGNKNSARFDRVTMRARVQHANPWAKLHLLLDYKFELPKCPVSRIPILIVSSHLRLVSQVVSSFEASCLKFSTRFSLSSNVVHGLWVRSFICSYGLTEQSALTVCCEWIIVYFPNLLSASWFIGSNITSLLIECFVREKVALLLREMAVR
jgi:hypothetical protein